MPDRFTYHKSSERNESFLKTIEELREFFEADRFAAEMGAVITECGEGGATVEMDAGPRHLNAAGTVQGGALFTLADFAFAVAANAGGVLTVSLQNSISFLHAVKPGRLTARAERVSETRRTCCYDVSVTDEAGNLTARMSVTGYRRD